jgi:hypothetical protein
VASFKESESDAEVLQRFIYDQTVQEEEKM